MKIKRIDRRIERNILIGLIVDRNYLAKLAAKYRPELMRNSYARTVAGWCFDYFAKYDQAPGTKIQDIYHYQSKREVIDESDVDLIETLLQSISDEFSLGEHVNTDFLLDKTEEYFNRVRIEGIITKAEAHLEAGSVKAAQEAILSEGEIRLAAGMAVDPLADPESLRAAFESTTEPLFQLEGDLGRFFNEHLCRDYFIVGQGPEKCGKTWLAYWFALQAVKARRKTVIFAVGDMTEKQSQIRLSIAIAGKSNKAQYCGRMYQTTKLLWAKDDASKWSKGAPAGVDLDAEEIVIDNPLTHKEASEKVAEFYKKHRLKPDRYFKMVTSPANHMNIASIEAELDRLEKQEDFIADVVIIDYMDILAPENSRDIGRDKINGNWIAAKALCNKRHVLLMSFTQSNKASYNGELQSRDNVAEDKRKFAHPNGIFAMNQTDNEKKAGVQKLNWLALREGAYTASDVCYVAQNLRRGQAVCASLMAHGENSGSPRRQEDPTARKRPPRDDGNQDQGNQTEKPVSRRRR